MLVCVVVELVFDFEGLIDFTLRSSSFWAIGSSDDTSNSSSCVDDLAGNKLGNVLAVLPNNKYILSQMPHTMLPVRQIWQPGCSCHAMLKYHLLQIIFTAWLQGSLETFCCWICSSRACIQVCCVCCSACCKPPAPACVVPANLHTYDIITAVWTADGICKKA